MSVGGDIDKIGRDFRCKNVTNNLKFVTNLGSFTRKRNVVSNGVVKLKTLVKVILSNNLNKNDSFRVNTYTSPSLAVEQTTYDCLDNMKSL